MTLKMYQLLEFLESYNELKKYEFNIKTTYKLSKCFDKGLEEQKFYQDKINDLLLSYAELDENNNFKFNESNTGILIKKDKQKEWEKKFQELLNLDIDIDDKYLINIDELNIDITMDSLNKIKPFITE